MTIFGLNLLEVVLLVVFLRIVVKYCLIPLKG